MAKVKAFFPLIFGGAKTAGGCFSLGDLFSAYMFNVHNLRIAREGFVNKGESHTPRRRYDSLIVGRSFETTDQLSQLARGRQAAVLAKGLRLGSRSSNRHPRAVAQPWLRPVRIHYFFMATSDMKASTDRPRIDRTFASRHLRSTEASFLISVEIGSFLCSRTGSNRIIDLV